MAYDQVYVPLCKELKTGSFWQNHPEHRMCRVSCQSLVFADGRGRSWSVSGDEHVGFSGSRAVVAGSSVIVGYVLFQLLFVASFVLVCSIVDYNTT